MNDERSEMSTTGTGQATASGWVRRPPVAPPLGDPDAQDDAIEAHHEQHLAEQREQLQRLEEQPTTPRVTLEHCTGQIGGSERALAQVAIRRRERDRARAV
jgi:hypothetical protein